LRLSGADAHVWPAGRQGGRVILAVRRFRAKIFDQPQQHAGAGIGFVDVLAGVMADAAATRQQHDAHW
jgi:hypothetical protein